MGQYADKAVEYFKSGYNCAQAVFLAFSEKYGIDKDTALKLSSSFGGGMGRLREVCGAVSSMFAVAGLENGYTENNNDEIKAKHYELIQKLAKQFKGKYGSIICRELLNLSEQTSNPIPSKRNNEYYQTRPCVDYVKGAAEILEEYL